MVLCVTFTNIGMTNIESIHQLLRKYQHKFNQHPFIQSLLKGSLSEETFQSFLKQDAFYLQQDAELMLTYVKKCPNQQVASFIHDLAQSNIEFEQMMQRAYLKKSDTNCPDKCSVIQSYLEYLKLLVDSKDMIYIVAAFYPCFRMYAQLGKYIEVASIELKEHPYASWIATYCDASFEEYTLKFENVLTHLLETEDYHFNDLKQVIEKVAYFECAFLSCFIKE